jgi:nucleolar protein 4
MSRSKRQRLTADGHDKVTASSDEAVQFDANKLPERVDVQQPKEQHGRSLFVSALPVTATTESLTNLFSQSYPIKHATVVVDPITKSSKGYGFVTFADVEDAQTARQIFNGSLFDGQKIKVKTAQPRQRQANEDGSTSAPKRIIGQQKPDSQPPPKLIVRNLPWTVKDSDGLAALFRSYGKVKHATIPKKRPGLSAGFGFVVLRGRKNAERALAGVNGKEIEGRTLAVDWAVEKVVWETLQKGHLEAQEQSPKFSDSPNDHSEESVKFEENEAVIVGNIPHGDVEQQDISDSEVDEDDDKDMLDDGDLSGHSTAQTTRNSPSTLFIRNLPFTADDGLLLEHFTSFGPVRYARVVLDHTTERSKGTGFVCFYNLEDADACLREAPRIQPSIGHTSTANKGANTSSTKQSLLEDTSADLSGRYTLEGRVLHVTRAVDRTEATRLTFAGNTLRDARDKDRRRIYLLSEGTVPSSTPLYDQLSASEVKMREDSAKQRQLLIRTNPALHLSLTRLSVRNLPRSVTSKDLKALAREAAVGFASDVKAGTRRQLSKEELARGGEEMKEAEQVRKTKGKGIVKQAKVVFEGREGGKVAEHSGAGRSRGYGFIEYSSHRWALMGLRWLNGHAVGRSQGTPATKGPMPAAAERKKRLIVEFAIENAQVVGRRHEREAKARERSKLVSERREKGELPAATSKMLSKDQMMAKTRKGMKRKRGSSSAASDQTDAVSTSAVETHLDKSAKRQQIIGRKRMLRKSRAKASHSG